MASAERGPYPENRRKYNSVGGPWFVFRCQNRKPPFHQITCESPFIALFNLDRQSSLSVCDSDKVESNLTDKLSRLKTQLRSRGWFCSCGSVWKINRSLSRIEFIQGNSTC
jgi:hypothetical protein